MAKLSSNAVVIKSAGSLGFLLLLAFGPVSHAPAASAPAADTLKYNRQIRPILSENCFPCHGTDSAARKGGLRLDRFEDAIAPHKDSKPAIVPGKAGESAVIARIFADDPDDIMPPVKSHKVLSKDQKDLLKRWIIQGAKYEPHWSLIAPVKAPLPKTHNPRWAHNPIDTFILARLDKEGLKPAAEADRRTLARRLSLDLTGLPPDPGEVDAFVKDRSPRAYEKLVDHYLASEHWGEHRARYWLDAARYADSNGIHMDNYREMWAYRDWVINAFNANEHFDQFTIENLAGDLLPNRTLEQQIASGFNRCNITTSEGGAIDEEYYVLYDRDRTDATSQVWLGLTAGCAVCHDHKYDRLSQKEFYSMAAFFNNTTQKAMDGNVKDTPPIIFVPLAADRTRWASLTADKRTADEALKKRRESAKPEFNTWLTKATPEAFSSHVPTEAPALQLMLADNETNVIHARLGETEKSLPSTNALAWQDGVLASKAFTTSSKTTPEIPEAGDFERDQSFSYSVWVRLGEGKDGALFSRMDDKSDFRGWDLWLQGGKPGTHIISKWPENALKVVGNKALEANRWTHLCVTYDGSSKASGVKIYLDGEIQGTTVEADKLSSSIKTPIPFKLGQRHTTSPIEKAGLQDVRLYAHALKPDEIKSLGSGARFAWLLSEPADKRSDADQEELYKAWLTQIDKEYLRGTAEVARLGSEETEIKARGSTTQVMDEKKEEPSAYVLYRGEYTQRKDKVTASTPEALPPLPKDFPRNRLGFAKWLLLPEQPLTARVTVNRFWQEVFGTGIVRTTGDFGVSGEMPSHPELLDWLAVDFQESGWDVKRLFKLMVMSAAYQQGSVVTEQKLFKDPQNRLLSRGPRFRMDAEMVRDYALSASGLMVPKIGGPSVKPYQPDGVWEAIAMDVSNTRIYKRDSGESLYRRSLYTFWKRQAPPAMLDIFNAPNRETCTVRRERSDTPLQALATLNDTQFVEAARHLAEKALKNSTQDDSRLDFMAQRLLARPLNPEELKIARSSLSELTSEYRSAPAQAEALLKVGESRADPSLDKITLAAYAMVANEFMNLDEVLNK